MKFADRLSELMKSKEISAYRLKNDLKLSNSIVSNWLDESSFPDGRNLIKLADYFDVSLDYLVGRSDDPTMHTIRHIYRGTTPEGKTLITVSSGMGEPTKDDFKKADAARKRVADQLLPEHLDEEVIQRIVDDRIRKFLEGAEPKRIDVD